MQKEICWHVAVEHPGQSGPNIQEHLEVCDLCPFYICDGLHIPGKNSAGEKPQEKEQPLDQAAPCPFSLADVQMRVEAALRQLWHLAYICILIKECRPMLEWWCTSILSAFNISIFLGPVLWACLNFIYFFFFPLPPEYWVKTALLSFGAAHDLSSLFHRHLPLSFRLCSQFSGSLSGPLDTFAAPDKGIFTRFCTALCLCVRI